MITSAILLAMTEVVSVQPITAVSVGPSYSYPDSIKPPVERYWACLDRAFDERLSAGISDPDELRALPKHTRDACVASRRTSLEEASSILKREGGSEADRTRVIQAAFATHEEGQRQSAEAMARLNDGNPANKRAAEQTPRQRIKTTQLANRITIPDEIAPAVVPYLMCMQDAFNAAQARVEARQRSHGLGLAEMKEANAAAVSACAATRSDARRKALVLAKSIRGTTPESRPRIVDTSLMSIDGMNDALIAMFSTPVEFPK